MDEVKFCYEMLDWRLILKVAISWGVACGIFTVIFHPIKRSGLEAMLFVLVSAPLVALLVPVFGPLFVPVVIYQMWTDSVKKKYLKRIPRGP